MRLILVDRSDKIRRNFFPPALSRPLWELRCGITTLEEKLAAKLGMKIATEDTEATELKKSANKFSDCSEVSVAKNGADDAAYFVPDYMADAYRARARCPVNDMSALAGDDLMLVDPLVKVEDLPVQAKGKSEVGLDEQWRTLRPHRQKRSGETCCQQHRGLYRFSQAAPAKCHVQAPHMGVSLGHCIG